MHYWDDNHNHYSLLPPSALEKSRNRRLSLTIVQLAQEGLACFACTRVAEGRSQRNRRGFPQFNTRWLVLVYTWARRDMYLICQLFLFTKKHTQGSPFLKSETSVWALPEKLLRNQRQTGTLGLFFRDL